MATTTPNLGLSKPAETDKLVDSLADFNSNADLLDGIIGAFAGLLLRFLQLALGEVCPNTVVFNLVCSFLVGLSVCTAGRLFPILTVETIMVGDIMLLIPGLAMTNALRDILIGDTISGVMRMIECVLWAGGLAGGFMAAMWLIGG